MSIVNKVKSIFINKTIDNHTVPKYQETESSVLNEKLKSFHGENNLATQQMYEAWCVKDYWNLQQQAIPLSIGLDPELTDWQDNPEIKSRINEIYEHAVHCIEHNLSLSVRDKDQDKNNWEIVPAEFYRWAAVSRIEIPEQMSALMEFVISSVKTSSFATDDESAPISPEATTLSHDFDKEKEIILGAALALLAKQPDSCKDSKGKIKPSKIVNEISQQQEKWFEGKEPKLSISAQEDLLIKWLGSL